VFFAAQDHLDLAFFLAVDGIGRDAFEEDDGLVDARLELVETEFAIRGNIWCRA
jgi:hypothetical protein